MMRIAQCGGNGHNHELEDLPSRTYIVSTKHMYALSIDVVLVAFDGNPIGQSDPGNYTKKLLSFLLQSHICTTALPCTCRLFCSE